MPVVIKSSTMNEELRKKRKDQTLELFNFESRNCEKAKLKLSCPYPVNQEPEAAHENEAQAGYLEYLDVLVGFGLARHFQNSAVPALADVLGLVLYLLLDSPGFL